MGRAEFSAGADGAGESHKVAAMIFLCTCVALALRGCLALRLARAALLARCARGLAGCAALTRAFRWRGRSTETLGENLERKLSGLTRSSLRDVEALAPGSAVYLFNVNDKRMHGVFESARAPCSRACVAERRRDDPSRLAPCAASHAPRRRRWGPAA